MPDDQLNKQMAEVDAWGRKQYGDEHWDSNIRRFRESLGEGGAVPEAVMRAAVKDPNAARNFFEAGREARLRLLQQAQDCRDGNPALAAQLDAEDRAIRQRERETYLRAKGRIR